MKILKNNKDIKRAINHENNIAINNLSKAQHDTLDSEKNAKLASTYAKKATKLASKALKEEGKAMKAMNFTKSLFKLFK